MAGPLSNAVCSPLLAKLLGTRLRAILFSCSCTCVRAGDTRRASAEAASRLLKILALLRLSFRISRFRGSAAPWPANPGQVAFAAELFIFSKKGAALYQHLKRVGNDMKSNICSVNSFSNDRVRILFAENAFRTCRCRSSDFTGVECMKHR